MYWRMISLGELLQEKCRRG